MRCIYWFTRKLIIFIKKFTAYLFYTIKKFSIKFTLGYPKYVVMNQIRKTLPMKLKKQTAVAMTGKIRSIKRTLKLKHIYK